MFGSTPDESRFPPVIPLPRPLSPIFVGIPEWESYKLPSEGDIGLKRQRNPRARSPPEAPPRKGRRTGPWAPPTDSGSPDGARDGGGATEDGDAAEDGNSTDDGNTMECGPKAHTSQLDLSQVRSQPTFCRYSHQTCRFLSIPRRIERNSSSSTAN